jgi:hypothetical protein
VSCQHSWTDTEGVDCTYHCVFCGHSITATDLLSEILDLRKVVEEADTALAAFGDEYEVRLDPLREAIYAWEEGLVSRGQSGERPPDCEVCRDQGIIHGVSGGTPVSMACPSCSRKAGQ